MTNVPPPDGDAPESPSPDAPSPVALAATETPVELRVALVEDDRTPEGMVCMGTFRGDRLIARCVLPPAAWEQIEEYGLFDEPVPVVLVARESPPGLQCQLFAMVPVPDLDEEEDEEEEADEPWAASVPGAGYEAAVADTAGDETGEDDEDEEDEDAGVTPLPLGNIVRYERDRVHPDSLPHEAADVLMKIIEGKTSEVVDRALADLLGL